MSNTFQIRYEKGKQCDAQCPKNTHRTYLSIIIKHLRTKLPLYVSNLSSIKHQLHKAKCYNIERVRSRIIVIPHYKNFFSLLNR